jgi:hypothetical protein
VRNRFWKIQVFDGQQEKVVATLPMGMLSESEMKTQLQRLASQHLNDNEVVAASLRKNAKGHSSLLEVTQNRGGRFVLMINGGSHEYTATVGDS